MLFILHTAPITLVAKSELMRDPLLLMSKNLNIEGVTATVAGKAQSTNGT